jgi:hypothetical protein
MPRLCLPRFPLASSSLNLGLPISCTRIEPMATDSRQTSARERWPQPIPWKISRCLALHDTDSDRRPPNKALQLPSHSAFQSAADRAWRRNMGASLEPRRRCGSQLSADPLGSVKEPGAGAFSASPTWASE